jgi:hypothetical protein
MNSALKEHPFNFAGHGIMARGTPSRAVPAD